MSIQVRARDIKDSNAIMSVLKRERIGYILFGENPSDDDFADQLTIYHPSSEDWFCLMIATFTATSARISINARMTNELASELANYLDESGFNNWGD